MSSFRRLDVFQKVNQDVDTSSSIGGLFSILALVVGFILFFNEYYEWTKYSVVRKLEVQFLNQAVIQANIDITFFDAPCYYILYENGQIVNQDDTNTIKKLRLDNSYKEIAQDTTSFQENQDISQQKFDEIVSSIKNKEKCRIFGKLNLSTIPGSFNFKIIQMQQLDLELQNQMNVNHAINKLSFGDPGKTYFLEKVLRLDKSDSSAFDESRYNYEYRCSYDNHIKILPLNAENIKSLDLKRVNTFRFTMYQQVIICAIIGGIFSVFGVINSLTLNVISSIKKK